jgi:hypothetical protein
MDAGVSAPAKALTVGFIGNQGKVLFSEILCWWGLGPSGTHRTSFGNGLEAQITEINTRLQETSLTSQKQNHHC